jgi:hypothetical protein
MIPIMALCWLGQKADFEMININYKSLFLNQAFENDKYKLQELISQSSFN